ncbi:MAG: hypothetical protein OXF94_09595, partial [Gammaproteobacteria bacterium]|nr:hypothetical protein [Gammaproteobacteria bacterium]
NYGMGSGGRRGRADAEAFVTVGQLHEAQEKSDHSNDAIYFQCIGLAYWVVEDTEQAMANAKLALKAVDPDDETFTCWRYRFVSAIAFKDDIGEMIELFGGKVRTAPPFVSK